MTVRRTLVLVPALLLLAAGAVAARAATPLCGTGCKVAPAGSGPLFLLTGHGWGHGVGMSQYGAYGYAQHGWTYQQILAHYFPGTTLGPAPVSRVRVLLADGQRSLTISSAADFRVKDGAGVVHQLPAGSYRLGPGLKLKVGTAPATALAPPLSFDPGAGAPLQLLRPYRGSIVVDVVDGKLRAINVVGLEQYLYGVVPSEMPYSWAPEALKTQAVVARSYALATRNVAAPFDLYSDTRSQMYLGVSHERPTTNAAVDATAGQVVLYGGQVAKTFFFSTSGGRTANVSDVFGGGTALPYLVSVPDPYDVISPYHDWGPSAYTGKQLAAAFHVPGAVDDARTTLNASGRVQELALLGSGGEVDVPGTSVRAKLGLRSTWFQVGVLSLLKPAAAKPVEYGGAVQLSGLARGVAPAELEQHVAGSPWQPVAALAPAADGTVAVSAKPTISTDYRFATAAAAAAPVHVSVAPRIRFSGAPTANEIRGVVRPSLTGAVVQIQRQSATVATAWATVATAAVAVDGSFDATLQLTPGVYRARIAPGHGFAVGVTPPLRVVPG